jgi:hypothetical protein
LPSLIQKYAFGYSGPRSRGDHAAAQESWRQARSELEPSLKEQPENDQLMGYLALTNVGLGDKAAAFKLVERAMAASPIEKDALLGPCSIENSPCNLRPNFLLYIREPARNEFLNNEKLKKAKTTEGN